MTITGLGCFGGQGRATHRRSGSSEAGSVLPISQARADAEAVPPWPTPCCSPFGLTLKFTLHTVVMPPGPDPL